MPLLRCRAGRSEAIQVSAGIHTCGAVTTDFQCSSGGNRLATEDLAATGSHECFRCRSECLEDINKLFCAGAGLRSCL